MKSVPQLLLSADDATGLAFLRPRRPDIRRQYDKGPQPKELFSWKSPRTNSLSFQPIRAGA